MINEMFYTYLHRRVDTNEVFYVGKGRGARAKVTKRRGTWWECIVAEAGGHAVQIVENWPTESEAFAHERFLITSFRTLGAPLCNRTLGGDGMAGHTHSAEARAKMAGRVFTVAHRAKLSAVHTGKALTSSHRAKLSAVKRGRTFPKLSEAKKGVPWSEARRAAQRPRLTEGRA